jgi:hypothetical protein
MEAKGSSKMDQTPIHQTLVERFEPYFKHRDPDHHVLKKGDRATACKNVTMALAKLGVARGFGDDPKLYDEELLRAVRAFQKATRHRAIDGRVGPGTRSRLVSRLLEDLVHLGSPALMDQTFSAFPRCS